MSNAWSMPCNRAVHIEYANNDYTVSLERERERERGGGGGGWGKEKKWLSYLIIILTKIKANLVLKVNYK